jgi:signal transduction histidine kinase
MRLAAVEAVSEPVGSETSAIHGFPVRVREHPHASLVVRLGRRRPFGLTLAREAARMLAAVLEHDRLLRHAVLEGGGVDPSERRLLRLGLDLHDGPIQGIVALGAELGLFRNQVAQLPLSPELVVRIAGWIADLEARIASVEDEIRELAHSLAISRHTDEPLERVLERELSSFRVRTSIEPSLSVEPGLDSLTPSQRIALVRVIQEALANVREHSDATAVRVDVRRRTHSIVADVEDNGRGFDVGRALTKAADRGRLGLVGMAERARLLGGSLEVESEPGGPTKISLVLPEWRPAAAAPSAGDGRLSAPPIPVG